DAGANCYPGGANGAYSSGCSPDGAKYCLKNTATSWQCVSSLRADGADCSNEVTADPSECQVGLSCEATDVGEVTCTAGAGVGDDCDALTADETDLTCAAGLTCKDAVCVAQVGP